MSRRHADTDDSNEKENQNAGGTNENDGDSVSSDISFSWLDTGVRDPTTGRVVHQAVQLTTQGRTFQVRKGDAVLLFSDETEWFAQWPCRVESIWEASDSEVCFASRWFYHKGDVPGNLQWQGVLTREQLAAGMLADEVVLSNHMDENDIATIEGPCYMTYRPPTRRQSPRMHQPKSFVCQYKADIQNDILQLSPITPQDRRILTTHLTSEQRQAIQEQRLALREQSTNHPPGSAPALGVPEEDDDDDDMSIEETDAPMLDQDDMQEEKDRPPSEIDRPPVEDTNNTMESSSSSSSDSDSSDSQGQAQIMEGEGTTLRSDISVGKKYQVPVGPFVPGQQVRSRGPKLVWKPKSISDEKVRDYLTRLAALHTPYLSQHGLTMQEPYSPLSAEQTEEFVRDMPTPTSLTGSSVSTASSVALGRNPLLKECDIDAALELLSDHGYNVDAALKAARGMLEDLSSGWTRSEKEMFDQNFRYYDGSLHMVGKRLGPTKTFRDVVDYFYRFKIPDKFRQYQDKKREQAVRMIECIEKKRYLDPSTYPSGENAAVAAATTTEADRDAKRRKPWSETSVAETTGAVEERRKAAKDLLLEVQKVKGRDTMAEVASIVRQLHSSYDPETKDALFSLLRDHPDLQKRFLDFLPKRY